MESQASSVRSDAATAALRRLEVGVANNFAARTISPMLARY